MFSKPTRAPWAETPATNLSAIEEGLVLHACILLDAQFRQQLDLLMKAEVNAAREGALLAVTADRDILNRAMCKLFPLEKQ